MSQNPIIVVNTFVERFGKTTNIEHMKLQKLLFYAYGWWLTNHGHPFLSAKPEVWRYGPVFSSVYWKFNRFGSSPITTPQPLNPFKDEASFLPREVEEESNFIDRIWDMYGNFDGMFLSEQAHKNGTPWQLAAENCNYKVPQNFPIDDEITKSYFCGLERTGQIF
jgi:uncharacterized phage-associated protein